VRLRLTAAGFLIAAERPKRRHAAALQGDGSPLDFDRVLRRFPIAAKVFEDDNSWGVRPFGVRRHDAALAVRSQSFNRQTL